MPGTRREVMGLGAALLAAPLAGVRGQERAVWGAGPIAHLLPAVSHEAILLKASFRQPVRGKVELRVGSRRVLGMRTDSAGRFWAFRQDGLEPGRTYPLQITVDGDPVCDTWPLRTFPAPADRPDRLRILTFMCAGGDETARGPRGIESFRPLATRQRLLARGLAFNPQLVVANGDHIYWDQKSWLRHANPEIRTLTKAAYDRTGYFDPLQAMLGTSNEALLKHIGDNQIARLYGTMLRSTPSCFVPDDHDYLENDEASPDFVTFPPDTMQREAQRLIHQLYLPEFIGGAAMPSGLPATVHEGWAAGLNRSFGQLRYGTLFEGLLWDTAGYLDLKGPSAGLVPPEIEAWLMGRIAAKDAVHQVHFPSFPIGWSAGKWREWYPDVVARTGPGSDGTVASTHSFAAPGRLTTGQAKYLWQPGWYAQHQRLIRAIADSRRPGIFAGGDIHAVGRTRITRSGDVDLAANPIHSFLVGSIGASTAGWPSFARGTAPSTPESLSAPEFLPPSETNGFTLLDIEQSSVTVRQFRWGQGEPLEAIDRLMPFDETVIPPAPGDRS